MTFLFTSEIEPLIRGIKASASVGYCASIAAAYFMDGIVPGNAIVSFSKKNSREESDDHDRKYL